MKINISFACDSQLSIISHPTIVSGLVKHLYTPNQFSNK